MNKSISVDVLLYWYNAAKRRLERGIGTHYPHNPERDQRERESYESAQKTVEELAFLENYTIDIEIAEPQKTASDFGF